jgi:hypothetical protein
VISDGIDGLRCNGMEWNNKYKNIIIPRAAGGGRCSRRLIMMMMKMSFRTAKVKGLFCWSLDSREGDLGMEKTLY